MSPTVVHKIIIAVILPIIYRTPVIGWRVVPSSYIYYFYFQLYNNHEISVYYEI